MSDLESMWYMLADRRTGFGGAMTSQVTHAADYGDRESYSAALEFWAFL